MKEQFERKAIEYSRGKTAGHEVWDDDNNLIVDRGELISDEKIQQALQKGKLQYLMLSAAASVVGAGGESVHERLKEFQGVTEGHEKEFVKGKISGKEVQDIEGNILVQQGQTVTNEMVETAERQGILQELVLAVGAPGILTGPAAEPEARERPERKMGHTPYPHA